MSEVTKMPVIEISVMDLTKGFWPAMHKLVNEGSLDFTTKVRVGAIFKGLSVQADELQKKYNEELEKLPKVEGQDQKVLDTPEKRALEEQFLKTEILVTGRKVKAEKLANTKLSASDLLALTPILDGLEDAE